MIEVYFDGLCAGNPYGRGGIGVVILRDGEIIQTISDYIGKGRNMSNNVAEYEALKRALDYLKVYGFTDEQVIAYGDSKIVIEQMQGKWKIKKGIYKDKATETQEIAGGFKDISFYWIAREKNTQANELSQKGVNSHEDKPC